MTITSVLAVVIVKDVQASLPWYERLFGQPADNIPMPSCAEWRLGNRAWVQVISDAGRPGASMLTLEVEDMDEHIAELSARGVALEPFDAGNAKVRLAQVTDPDGNVVTFAQDLIGH